MNRKIWATIVVAVLVLCPVAMACISFEAASPTMGNEVSFDPEDEEDTTPDGVGGNDPEHPQ
ncbi:MAG: hypothetical protein HXS48_24595 [Theionarchaea archaeon]|nr:MAG: hypothetical protein AYK19_21615 [Theionarchaea archaeon DG-70-1]MBU7030135.1 hypothetical protein [Theionarchaea archaeon]